MKETKIQRKEFRNEAIKIAVPVALQGLLQSSFSMVDQILVGQLGEVSIAGIGLAGKFSSLYSVLLSAIAAVAGICLAQYIGKGDEKEAGRCFYLNLCIGMILALVFLGVSMAAGRQIMGIYTKDSDTCEAATIYLTVVALGYLPRVFSMLYATLLRCKKQASIPLYATLLDAVQDGNSWCSSCHGDRADHGSSDSVGAVSQDQEKRSVERSIFSGNDGGKVEAVRYHSGADPGQ